MISSTPSPQAETEISTGRNSEPLTIPGRVATMTPHLQRLIRHNWALADHLDQLWDLRRAVGSDPDLLNRSPFAEEIMGIIEFVEAQITTTTRDILEYYADF